MGKSKNKKNNINKVKVTKKSKKEMIIDTFKDNKVIMILALVFSIYAAFFPKDYTGEIKAINEKMDMYKEKIQELKGNAENLPNLDLILEEVKGLEAERDKLQEELNSLQ